MSQNGIPITAEDTDQVVPTTSRKVYVAVDENGIRIGETHGNAKLTDAQVDEIRDLAESKGMRARAIAELFGAPVITIEKILSYERRATTIARWKVILLHTPISLTNPLKED